MRMVESQPMPWTLLWQRFSQSLPVRMHLVGHCRHTSSHCTATLKSFTLQMRKMDHPKMSLAVVLRKILLLRRECFNVVVLVCDLSGRDVVRVGSHFIASLIRRICCWTMTCHIYPLKHWHYSPFFKYFWFSIRFFFIFLFWLFLCVFTSLCPLLFLFFISFFRFSFPLFREIVNIFSSSCTFSKFTNKSWTILEIIKQWFQIF